LGSCYLNSVGVKRDQAKAVDCFRKAAELGDADAMQSLGWCYANGVGVAKDFMTAVEWVRKAADSGSTEAKESLKRLGKE
jgi:TPR repeat protein